MQRLCAAREAQQKQIRVVARDILVHGGAEDVSELEALVQIEHEVFHSTQRDST